MRFTGECIALALTGVKFKDVLAARHALCLICLPRSTHSGHYHA